MRILLVGAYPPPHGGVQTNLVAIRDYARRQGHQCGVINTTRFRRANADEVYYPHTAGEVLKLLWTLPYDVVHFHLGGGFPLRVQALALACATAPGKKSVLTFHSGGYPSSPEGKTAGYWTRRGVVLRQFNRVITVNEELVAMFRKFGVANEKLRIIAPHAVPALSPDMSWPENLAQFFDDHSPVLASVGGLEPEYDVALQIRTFGRIRERYPRAGLMVIGSGSLDAEIRQLASEQPWKDHMLLCGDVPHPITLQVIATCDVLLRTTLYDGDAISIREALHFGTPVVATDNGMRPEGVRLMPIGDADGLVAAVQTALQAGRAPRPSAEEQNRNLQAVLDVYTELVG